MRVLWFTNTPCNYVKYNIGFNGGGWLTSLQNYIIKHEEFNLGVCFIMNNQPYSVVKENVTYYPINSYEKPFKEKVLGYIRYNDITIDKRSWSYYIDKFKKIIDDFKPDLIHIFGSELYMGLASFASEIPCILHIQGTLNPIRETLFPPGMSVHDFIFIDWNPKNIINRYFYVLWWDRNCYREREILKNVKHVIGRTEWDRRSSYVINPNRVYHFGEEIMREPFYHPYERILPQKLTINTVISAPYYKGYDLVLKTANCLKTFLNMDFEWNVYGNVCGKYLEKQIGIKHKDVNVRLKGVVTAEEIREIHSKATLYYHSSYIENGCNAIIEAQMCGCTPIANYVGGLSSTVHDKETGFLVPANDIFQSAYLIKYLYENPKENLKIGQKASNEAFARHNPERIVEDLFITYNKVINDRKNI